jgi:hypothetical protein
LLQAEVERVRVAKQAMEAGLAGVDLQAMRQDNEVVSAVLTERDSERAAHLHELNALHNRLKWCAAIIIIIIIIIMRGAVRILRRPTPLLFTRLLLLLLGASSH